MDDGWILHDEERWIMDDEMMDTQMMDNGWMMDGYCMMRKDG